MAEFQELIKNFNKCRDYVRDFFVYGFKSRQDFTSDRKSARTYDDERRRISSWLSEYVVEDMDRVKNISLQIDSNLLDTNPLFSVWKTKSFTDNDIKLHFYLLDILCNDDSSMRPAYSANELADILSEEYSFPTDTQLVRRKCNEYVKEGLLETEKDGKTLLYKTSISWDELSTDENNQSLADAISLFQLTNPFGYIGNTILDRLSYDNQIFRVKHSFPTFTLEDEIAYELLLAKNEHSYVKMDIMSNKTGQTPRPVYGVPVKIFVSTRTGRRYICIYHKTHEHKHITNNRRDNNLDIEETKLSTPKFRFSNIRLDQIKKVTVIKPDNANEAGSVTITAATDAFKKQEEALAKNLDLVWGVSFEGMRTKVSLTLNIDEKYEGFILNRLEREGKNGSVTKLKDNTFVYEAVVFNANEMFPWLRTFIGRIIDIHFYSMNHNGEETEENTYLRRQFLEDINALTKLYE